MQENNVATEEISNSTDSAPETTDMQSPVSEDAQTPAKTAEQKYQDMLTALREERGKRKQASSELEELRARLETLEARDGIEEEAPTQTTHSEALAEVTSKMTQDPTFRDRLDLVEEKMTQGMTLEQADNAVLAEIARKMLYSSETSQQAVPQSIKTTALPETTRPRPTGNTLKDAIDGKLGIPEEQRLAIKRILGQ